MLCDILVSGLICIFPAFVLPTLKWFAASRTDDRELEEEVAGKLGRVAERLKRRKLVGRNVREKSVDDHETGLHPTASPEKN